ncbi:2-isopropylmalate synthase [Schaalia turicensis ACS-279-V-Col4]|uniref:2-isopropylmalate synthase n=1 Tax=Schaalia turicensis ACS-279-V-Col4 TaxID=883077 RepID=K0YQ33_9ACTO|nr:MULTISPECIES: 2-isopropylmalate synthase [Actinomycetaceae]EJZ85548.1 2-isopropylmalate synthase [Schaalia turicensis ACS-279-V-Col4]MDK7122226.1 2-isopropylmalate synthase [Pauljensenia sp. UMB6358]
MKTTGNVPTPAGSHMPIAKYKPFLDTNPVVLDDRRWPSNRITHAPRWMSTDLRDGNQALIEPMDPVRKRKMFDLLVSRGYKEIEIGFPAASQTDFDFVRSLIDEDAVPDDVTISVLTQSRPEIIERTLDALVGFPRATVHLYNATSPLFRELVFGNDKAQTIDLAVFGAREVVAQAEKRLGDETIFGFEYSPEIFVDTELDFALEICESVMDIWQPEDDREIILNLPATVERATPNVYADQIEYMARNLSRRDNIAISVHPHNDRGTGVAAAELALLAGADRVEGCLLGQGERTGNVDLLTLGLNLFSQGIDPGVDLTNIDEIRQTVEYCTSMETSPRAPYVGDLVYTSFSGSHQDAIKKGFVARKKKVGEAGGDENAVVWELPYLPIDPHDVGRSYEAVVRVNSQSGKGGVAYLMSTTHNLELPRRLQIEFSRIVQRHTDSYGGEIDGDTLWQIFADEYLPNSAAKNLTAWGRFELGASHVTTNADEQVDLKVTLTDQGEPVEVKAHAGGPIEAFVKALGQFDVDVRVLDYSEHAMSQGGDAKAASYVEAAVNDQILWGVGIDSSITRATYKAVISAVNRALR